MVSRLTEGMKTTDKTPQPPEGRDDAHDRHPCFSVRLENPNGNSFSVMYGSLVGSPAFDPSRGITFVFEALHGPDWKEAQWKVTITGSNLRSIYEHLCLSKQRFIRIGENDYDPGEGDVPLPGGDNPHVTAISVTEMKGVAKPARRGPADGEEPTIRERGRDEAMPGR